MDTADHRLPATALAVLVLTLFVAVGCTAACYPSLGGGGSSSAPVVPDKASTFTPAAAAGGY